MNKRSLFMNNHKFSYQLKEASVIDARATPPTIGRREPTTQGVGIYIQYRK